MMDNEDEMNLMNGEDESEDEWEDEGNMKWKHEMGK